MAIHENQIPMNRSGYRWWLLMVKILGISDSDVNSMTKTIAGWKSMVAGKALPGGGYDRFQAQAQDVIQSLGDNSIVTATNLTGLTTVAGVTAIFTTTDSALTNLPANSFAPPVGL